MHPASRVPPPYCKSLTAYFILSIINNHENKIKQDRSKDADYLTRDGIFIGNRKETVSIAEVVKALKKNAERKRHEGNLAIGKDGLSMGERWFSET